MVPIIRTGADQKILPHRLWPELVPYNVQRLFVGDSSILVIVRDDEFVSAWAKILVDCGSVPRRDLLLVFDTDITSGKILFTLKKVKSAGPRVIILSQFTLRDGIRWDGVTEALFVLDSDIDKV